MTIRDRNERVWMVLCIIEAGGKVWEAILESGLSDRTFYNAIHSCENLMSKWLIARDRGEAARRRLLSAESALRRQDKAKGKVRFCALCGKATLNRRYMITDRTMPKKERLYFCSRAHITLWDSDAVVNASSTGKRLFYVLEMVDKFKVCPSLISYIFMGDRRFADRAVDQIRRSSPHHSLVKRYDNSLHHEKGRVCRLPPWWIYNVIDRVGEKSIASLSIEYGGTEAQFFYWIRKSKREEVYPWIYQKYQDKRNG